MTTKLYRHFDEHGNLLYVGISNCAIKRFGEHRKSSPWIDLVTTITIQEYDTRAAALEAERIAIEQECPEFNIVNGVARKKFNKKMWCHLVKEKVDGDVVTFYFPHLENCDMQGAIDEAKERCPEVTRIVTYSGKKMDTCYYLADNGEWGVANPCGECRWRGYHFINFTNGLPDSHGYIVGQVSPRYFMVAHCDWIVGAYRQSEIVPTKDMRKWLLFPSQEHKEDWWRDNRRRFEPCPV